MNRYHIDCKRLGEHHQLLFQRQMIAYEAKRVAVGIAQARNAMAKAKDMMDREFDAIRLRRMWNPTDTIIPDPVNGAEDWATLTPTKEG